MANNIKGKVPTQIEVLKDHLLELTALADIADEVSTRLGKEDPPADGDGATAVRMDEFSRESFNHRERVITFMSLFEPESPSDTLVMAIIAATLMNVANSSEGPGVARDYELAEEFAWKAIRGIERMAGLTAAEIGMSDWTLSSEPFAERAGRARKLSLGGNTHG